MCISIEKMKTTRIITVRNIVCVQCKKTFSSVRGYEEKEQDKLNYLN